MYKVRVKYNSKFPHPTLLKIVFYNTYYEIKIMSVLPENN